MGKNPMDHGNRADGVIRSMIDEWLKAGCLEDGLLRHAICAYHIEQAVW
jgi:hypothetical protein